MDRSADDEAGFDELREQRRARRHRDHEQPGETAPAPWPSARRRRLDRARRRTTAKRRSSPARSPPLSCWERSAVANESTRGGAQASLKARQAPRPSTPRARGRPERRAISAAGGPSTEAAAARRARARVERPPARASATAVAIRGSPASTAAPVAAAARGQDPGDGAGPGQREKGGRRRADDQRAAATSKRRGPERGEPATLGSGRRVSLAARAKQAARPRPTSHRARAGLAATASRDRQRGRPARGGREDDRDVERAARQRRHTSRTPTPAGDRVDLAHLDDPPGAARASAPGARRSRSPAAPGRGSRRAAARRPPSGPGSRAAAARRPASSRGRSRARPSWPVLRAVSRSSASRPADLADHDPIRAHPQRVSQQVADRHLSAALDARRAALEPDHVRLAQAELGGVLDRDHALLRADDTSTAR